ncbi:hypothetical protein BB560_000262 [Smittium megazygosporum]|uniref:Uncharacterized protein n=1 Tax=Smittium megazygosporum TaxID=133381 RepID=A0A2T9ZKU2_9FUNG|nr:hypothetical protein BB560_000262 [Smittium megazygosporum]
MRKATERRLNGLNILSKDSCSSKSNISSLGKEETSSGNSSKKTLEGFSNLS